MQELPPEYYLSIGLFLLFLAGFIVWLVCLARYFHRRSLTISASFPFWKRGVVVLVGACLIGLCIFGIRGRTGYNPIKVSAAYFCQDAFLNQLGVSPTFNLLTSVMDDMRPENKYLHLMDEQEAITKAQALLNRQGEAAVSPLAVYRHASKADSVQQGRPNVVLIMMESMSSKLMKHFGQSETLTPFLDSLYTRSISFRNFYSAGIHTNHGMYATLYSFPSILKRNAMKGSVIPTYSGLPNILKEQGYRTMFFMTHESQYDNMNAFFRTNGFDEIFSQENYPSEKVVNGFGVQDDFLYDYALNHLKKQSAQTSPFFAVLLSISNHPPYVIPSYFQPKSKNIEEQIVEYADWSIRQFIHKASQQPWFDNTIFVLLGDHGKLVGNPDSEMPQSYNHIPLMFYAPALLTAEEKENFGGQIDVAPTLLGMLRINYIQNNLGIDLLKDNIIISHFAHSCNGGIKIDEFARTGVNGLYAIGEVASIIEGANRLGGNSLGGSLVFANRAIINAVEYIKNTKSFKLKKRDVEQDFNAWIREITREDKNNLLDKKSVIKILKNITSDNLGIVRSAEKVKRLFEELKNMRESYSIEKNLKEGSLEVYLMEESIKMLALSILNREESRGAHYREDFPETSNEVVKLNVKRKNNEFIIEKVKVK